MLSGQRWPWDNFVTFYHAPSAGQVTPGGIGLRAALQAAARVVGVDRVVAPSSDSTEPVPLAPEANVGMFRPRDMFGVVRPRTVDQVRRVVELFGHSAAAGALHPVSTGRNWGLGSRQPALDDAVLLDLSGLDRIRDVDIAGGWAILEPGVTQGQLAELLIGTTRMVNVTASSAHTSVLGNALDRGVGLRHQRVEDLVGLEVVLPDGDLIRVGWWPDADRPTPVYPHGLGPSLVQLFVQSNLGIATAAAVRLLPRPEALRVIRLSFGRGVLADAVDELRRWVSQGLIRGVLKVYDVTSAELYGGVVGEFLAHVCVDGTSATVDALTEVITEEAARSGLFSEVSRSDAIDHHHDNDVVTEMVERAYSGDPGHNDILLEATLGQMAEKVDEFGQGWLFFLPLVPFTGEAIAHAHSLLARINSETGIRCGGTLNALSPDVVDFVVSIKFIRRPDEVKRAHQALDRLYHLFTEAGFIPYRLDVDHFDWMDRLSPDLPSRAFVRRLKDAIDPNNGIARGRYW